VPVELAILESDFMLDHEIIWRELHLVVQAFCIMEVKIYLYLAIAYRRGDGGEGDNFAAASSGGGNRGGEWRRMAVVVTFFWLMSLSK